MLANSIVNDPMLTLIVATFVGITVFVISHQIRIPAIVLLLGGGVLLGPEGVGLIDPNVLGGDNLRQIVSLCVAIILFEGGLTLKLDGLKKAPKVIWMLLSVGTVVTWFGSALCVWGLSGMNLSMEMSLLAGSLIIVTGPTVITPLLKRINVKERLYHILHWEGVMIDPIGVFIAILCFDWVLYSVAPDAGGGIAGMFSHLGARMLWGIVYGGLGGALLRWLLRKNLIPESLANVFVFASALTIFKVADSAAHEAGILAAIIAGLIVGTSRLPILDKLVSFKAELTELSISIVFVLLAAKLTLSSFTSLGWGTVIMIATIMLVVRPVSIFLCSFGTDLNVREKLFLSWISPRGVIAGSMASYFGVNLYAAAGGAISKAHADFLEVFTFSIIACTIVIQGLSANKWAQILRVKEKEAANWLCVGANEFSWKVAEFVEKTSHSRCVFVDSNVEAVRESEKRGFTAIKGNAMSTEIQIPGWSSFDYILCLTDNKNLNQMICDNWSEIIKKERMFWWCPKGQEDPRVGTPIWTHLNKPSEVAYELRNKDVLLTKKPLHENDETYSCLISSSNNQFDFSPDRTLPQESEDKLYFQQYVFKLSNYINEDHVVMIPEGEKGDMFEVAFTQFAQLYPNLPMVEVAGSIRDREKEFPTLIAPGVVVPHSHRPEIKKPHCFLVMFPKGYVNEIYGDHPLRVAFFLLSPAELPELHLIMLGEIAKILSNPESLDDLTAADTPSEVMRVFHEIEITLAQ